MLVFRDNLFPFVDKIWKRLLDMWKVEPYVRICLVCVETVAPEVLRGDLYERDVDVYSFGILLWSVFSLSMNLSYLRVSLFFTSLII